MSEQTAIEELIEYIEKFQDDNNYSNDIFLIKCFAINTKCKLQAKHEEELKEAVIEAYLQGFKISGEGYNGEYPFEGYSNEKISNDIEAEQYYKANHETN